MPRFFVDDTKVYQDDGVLYVRITGDDAHHITHVLRTRVGESMVACDSHVVYRGTLCTAADEVVMRVDTVTPIDTEPPYKVTVYQALVKGDKMDTVIQKAVETGASVIVPVATRYAVVKLDGRDGVKKVERWQRIAEEAAKQCGRGSIPKVELPMGYREAVLAAKQTDLPLFCYEAEGTESLSALVKTVTAPETIAVFVGPEGGFSPEEAAFAHENGMQLCGLGKRILRTETAALFVLSCLSFAYEL